MNPFNLSSRLFSKIFWEALFQSTDAWQTERERLANELQQLEALRQGADYNTGSISFSASWSLYCLVRYFKIRSVIEVGTFIGKSTWAMARAMDDENLSGSLIHTCDSSNDIRIPWQGRTAIRQYAKAGSTDMLSKLEGQHESLFLDGRLNERDCELLPRLVDDQSIVMLDDFEGVEKGVVNATLLRRYPLFGNHFLVYPPTEEFLRGHGFSGYASTAVLLPAARVALVNQG